MPDSTNTQLAPLIERARKVLQYEQRGNHQDHVVKGGLELFAVRWADEASTICKNAGLDLSPIHQFTEHLEGYRRQDPMQRAASLRAALATLYELENNGQNEQNVVLPLAGYLPPRQDSLSGGQVTKPATPMSVMDTRSDQAKVASHSPSDST